MILSLIVFRFNPYFLPLPLLCFMFPTKLMYQAKVALSCDQSTRSPGRRLVGGRMIGKGPLFSSPPQTALPTATQYSLVKQEKKTYYLNPFQGCQEVLYSDMEVFSESAFLLFHLPLKIQQQKFLTSRERSLEVRSSKAPAEQQLGKRKLF